MYVPDASKLCGMSLERAELFGKPHIGAHYANASLRSNRLDEGAICAWCGRPACNSHHVLPLSRGRMLGIGGWRLRTALMAVCGSGTQGCHNGFHGGAWLKAEWAWDDDAYAEQWWDGALLKAFGPHDEALYCFGRWVLTDTVHGYVREVRGTDG